MATTYDSPRAQKFARSAGLWRLGFLGFLGFTHEDKAERERLAAIEAAANPLTIECLADIQSPEFHAIAGIHCAAWGRKPGGRV